MIHSHLGDLSGPIMQAAFKAGIKCRIAYYHSSGVTSGRWMSKYPLLPMIRKIILKRTRKLVEKYSTNINYCSYTCMEAHSSFFKLNFKTSVLRTGIDTNLFCPDETKRASTRKKLGIKKNSFMILSVGALLPLKNHLTAIRAIYMCKDYIPNMNYIIIGSGPEKSRLEREIKNLKCRDEVILLGIRYDVDEILKSADVYFFPSFFEGLPISVLEAEGCGLPIIGSNIGSNYEATPEEMHKYLHDPMDREAFARDLIGLYENPEIASGLGEEGRIFVEKEFSIRASLTSWLQVYNESLAR